MASALGVLNMVSAAAMRTAGSAELSVSVPIRSRIVRRSVLLTLIFETSALLGLAHLLARQRIEQATVSPASLPMKTCMIGLAEDQVAVGQGCQRRFDDRVAGGGEFLHDGLGRPKISWRSRIWR